MIVKRRYQLLLGLLLLMAFNVFIYLFDYRTAPSERNLYQLDEATIKILQKTKEPIIITFYQSDDLQPSEQHFADNIKQVLESYRRVRKLPVHIEIINPDESLEVKLEATNAGIKPIDIEGTDNILRTIFLGMIIQVGEKTEVLSHLTPQMSIEYLISSSLRKLLTEEPRKIAVIQGHGEPSQKKLSGIIRRLLPNYRLDFILLTPNTNILDYESLLIISPSFKYNDTELEQLNTFLEAGKNIFIALDRVEYDPIDKETYAINTRIEDWLVQKGIIINRDFIVDNSCTTVRADGYTEDIIFPYFPKITNFPSHITTEGISGISLRFASSIECVDKAGISHKTLVKTSKVSGKKSLPLRINLLHEWSKADYLYPEQTVAVIAEGHLGNNSKVKAKLFVISDADIAMSLNEKKEDGLLDNHLFIANIIDWLSDNSGLAAIKQKGVVKETKEPQEQISNWVRYFNFLLPLCIILLVAIGFFYRKKRHIDKLRTRTF